jgi:hypothetical protein
MRNTLHVAVVYFLVSCLAGAIMITSESLWIDEGQTWHFVKQPTIGAWFSTLEHNVKSEAQMPFGMFVFWLGAKAIGDSERALRALNLPWVGLAGVAVGLIGRLLKLRGLLLLFLMHPFLWYYTNEARPYAMQICAGAWLLFVFVKWYSTAKVQPLDLWLFGFAAVLGFGSSLLFAFPLAAFCGSAAWMWRRAAVRLPMTATYWLPLLASFAALGLLGSYYAYTLVQGAMGAKIWNLSPLNLAFALYEGLGFAGLGPARNDLRELGRVPSEFIEVILRPRFLIGIGSLASLYLMIAARLWKRRGDALVRWLASLLALCAVGLYVAAAAVDFPIWGRHLAGLLPAVVVLIMKGVVPGDDSAAGAPARAMLLLVLVVFAASSLTLRFRADYGKDDYRTAVSLAKGALADGKTVWWSADSEECAEYYGLTMASVPPGPARLIWMLNPSAEELTRDPMPDVVFQSKPDVHDPSGHLSAYLAKRQFVQIRQLPAFTIWAPGRIRGQTN